MARKPTKSISTKSGTANALASLPVEASTHLIAARVIKPDAAFKNPERHPRGPGPWEGEYDKLGWTDEATGLRCIILRQRNGTLSGYVGVGTVHPLYGFNTDAIPGGLGIGVHGGLTYAKACEQNLKDEFVSICHLSRQTKWGTKDAFTDHEETWWFGFDCDLDCDMIPQKHRFTSGRTDHLTYRDQSYVYREIVRLAAQLSEIQTGVPISLDDDVAAQVPPALHRD